MVCVAVSEFAIGNAVSRLHRAEIKPVYIFLGALILLLGGSVAIWDLYQSQLYAEKDDWETFAEQFFGMSKIFGTAGLFVGLLIMFRIVLRQEEETDKLAQYFTSLADLINEGFAFVTPDGTISRVNRSFCLITGLSEEDLQSPASLSRLEGLGFNHILKTFTNSDENKTTEYQVTWHRKDGPRRLLMNCASLLDSRGNFLGMFAAIRDITDVHEMALRLEKHATNLQKLVEDRTEKLRHSEDRLRNLLLHMSEGFATLDGEGRVTFANERLCQMLKSTKDDVIGKPITDFLNETTKTKIAEWLEDFTQHSAKREEWVVRAADNKEIYVVAALTPIPWKDEAGAQYSLVFTDIGELKRMQVELERRAADLDAANKELRRFGQAKDAFLTTVGHELRTPLSTVLGYLEMFNSGGLGDVSPVQQKAISVITRNAERLRSLIEEIIEFSRIQIRGIEVDLSLFNPEPLIRECCRSFLPSASQKNVTLEFTPLPNTIGIWADKKRFLQALSIFVSNAIKFSPENSTINVGMQIHKPYGVSVFVKDQGIGIDPIHQKRIFETFYQVDQSLSRRYEGAGIGLSVAKAIADAHASFIQVQSALGQGACFSWVLPHGLFAVLAETGDKKEKKLLDGREILFIKNEIDEDNIFSEYLAKQGASITSVGGSVQGLRALTEQTFDIIIMDCGEQYHSINRVVEKFRELPTCSETPIVFICPRSHPENVELSLSQKGVYHVRLPAPAEEIARRLQVWLNEDSDATNGEGLTPREQKSLATTIVILDEDTALRRWLETVLQRKGFVCFSIEKTEELTSTVMKYNADYVLIDWDSEQTDNSSNGILENLIMRWEESGSPRVILMTAQRRTLSTLSRQYRILHKPFRMEDLFSVLEPLKRS